MVIRGIRRSLMSFGQTIEMLSKGSAQAVTTLGSASKEAAKLKKSKIR